MFFTIEMTTAAFIPDLKEIAVEPFMIFIWLCIVALIVTLVNPGRHVISIFKRIKRNTHTEYKGVIIQFAGSMDKEKLKEIKAKIDMWETIHEKKLCPECGAKDMMMRGPSGGIAVNIFCDTCNTKFWTTPVKAMGAEKI